jgi:hypothetical protein
MWNRLDKLLTVIGACALVALGFAVLLTGMIRRHSSGRVARGRQKQAWGHLL